MKLRLVIEEPDDLHECEILPFEELSAAEHIRIFETTYEGKTLDQMEEWERLAHITGAPMRYIRIMSIEEVRRTMQVIEQVVGDRINNQRALYEIHKELSEWEEKHKKKWTFQDAHDLFNKKGLFKTEIKVNSRTYTAPLIEPSAYGKYISLEASMDKNKDEPETRQYIEACAIMMEGEDGAFPEQDQWESDAAYEARCTNYKAQRRKDFAEAKFVDVMGCAAFFFSKWPSYQEILSPYFLRFQPLLQHYNEQMRRSLPTDTELMQELGRLLK